MFSELHQCYEQRGLPTYTWWEYVHTPCTHTHTLRFWKECWVVTTTLHTLYHNYINYQVAQFNSLGISTTLTTYLIHSVITTVKLKKVQDLPGYAATSITIIWLVQSWHQVHQVLCNTNGEMRHEINTTNSLLKIFNSPYDTMSVLLLFHYIMQWMKNLHVCYMQLTTI